MILDFIWTNINVMMYHFIMNKFYLIFLLLAATSLLNGEEEKIKIFTYGSLVNKDSAIKTLSPNALKSLQKASAYGVKRLYNRRMAKNLITARFGPLKTAQDLAALNIKRVSDMSCSVNGVLFEVDRKELKALEEREIGYRLIPVLVSKWDGDQKSKNRFFAFTFSAPDEPSLTSNEIDPIPGYFDLVYQGFANYGDQFLEEYLKETTLSDEKTTLFEWMESKKIKDKKS